MYNEKIEQLIKAALADGVLTEKEKQVLFKNAQAQGIDLDEFEMVLDARLVELQKAAEENSAPKSDKYGDVRKCPACGAIVGAFKGICPECGYEFSNIDANLSSKRLYDAIAKESDPNRKAEIIETFPIPNTKADLLEFLTALKPRVADINDEFAKAYYKKYSECIEKAKVSFFGDKQLLLFIEDFETLSKVLKKKKVVALLKKRWYLVAIIIVILVSVISSSISSSKEKKQIANFETCILNSDFDNARTILKSINFSNSYDKYDLALKLIEAYTNNNDVANAIDIYENFTSAHCNCHDMQYDHLCHGKNSNYEPRATELLRVALIKVGEYDKALSYYPQEYSSRRYASEEYGFMLDVVKHLCNDNRKEEAKTFVNRNLHRFESLTGEYSPYNVKKRLLDYINRY